VVNTGADEAVIIEQDPTVGFVRDHPNWLPIAIGCFGQTVGEALEGGGRIDAPAGIVWGIHENRSGPGS
jgi:hypothetical protein